MITVFIDNDEFDCAEPIASCRVGTETKSDGLTCYEGERAQYTCACVNVKSDNNYSFLP